MWIWTRNVSRLTAKELRSLLGDVPLVSSTQTIAVEFDCRKGSQTGPCSLVAAGVFEPVPEYRTHGHRAGLH